MTVLRFFGRGTVGKFSKKRENGRKVLHLNYNNSESAEPISMILVSLKRYFNRLYDTFKKKIHCKKFYNKKKILTNEKTKKIKGFFTVYYFFRKVYPSPIPYQKIKMGSFLVFFI